MTANLQRGSSALAFVLLLFFLGMLMLNGLQQQLNQQQDAVAREVGYLKSYAGAVSALAWGSQVRWQGTNERQCQQKGSEWRACMLMTAKRESVLAGHMLSENEKHPVTLWRWGYLKDDRWHAAPHGWLDFCPFREEAQCLLPE